ncbi:SCO2584 family spore wall biosynthesis protein [Streptomyces sp. NPDC001889]
MPDDVGGRPFPDGWEPDDDRGGADEDFASAVFDEDFVRAAEIHEPTAVERLLAAAQARAEAEAARAAGSGRPGRDDDPYGDGYGPHDRERLHDDGPLDDDGPYGRHGGALRPYRSSARWHRPVAWILALLMGIGMVALAFTAVYRGAAGSRQDQVPPPATSGVDATNPAVPSADRLVGPALPADRRASSLSAEPRTP